MIEEADKESEEISSASLNDTKIHLTTKPSLTKSDICNCPLHCGEKFPKCVRDYLLYRFCSLQRHSLQNRYLMKYIIIRSVAKRLWEDEIIDGKIQRRVTCKYLMPDLKEDQLPAEYIQRCQQSDMDMEYVNGIEDPKPKVDDWSGSRNGQIKCNSISSQDNGYGYDSYESSSDSDSDFESEDTSYVLDEHQKYFPIAGTVEVCQKAFINIYGIAEKRIRYLRERLILKSRFLAERKQKENEEFERSLTIARNLGVACQPLFALLENTKKTHLSSQIVAAIENDVVMVNNFFRNQLWNPEFLNGEAQNGKKETTSSKTEIPENLKSAENSITSSFSEVSKTMSITTNWIASPTLEISKIPQLQTTNSVASPALEISKIPHLLTTNSGASSNLGALQVLEGNKIPYPPTTNSGASPALESSKIPQMPNTVFTNSVKSPFPEGSKILSVTTTSATSHSFEGSRTPLLPNAIFTNSVTPPFTEISKILPVTTNSVTPALDDTRIPFLPNATFTSVTENLLKSLPEITKGSSVLGISKMPSLSETLKMAPPHLQNLKVFSPRSETSKISALPAVVKISSFPGISPISSLSDRSKMSPFPGNSKLPVENSSSQFRDGLKMCAFENGTQFFQIPDDHCKETMKRTKI